MNHPLKKVRNIISSIILIDVEAIRVSGELENSKSLDLNLYEIRIDSTFVEKKELIEVMLYECQCALFLVDITKSDSFSLLKNLLNNIKLENFPYLKIILVQNKLDLENTRQVSSFEIKEFLENNQYLDSQEISLKDGNNVKELLKKINKYVNETKNELPSNIVLECLEKKLGLMSGQGSLSFILIGDSTVGKTCFLTRYFKNTFSEIFVSTMGIDKEIKFVKIGDDIYKMTLWDTTGQERFKSLPKKYYQNADGVLLLFDVTSEDTFNNVTNWMQDVKENSSKTVSNENGKESEIALYLIGNKIDLPGRQVTKEQAQEQAKSLGMKYFEVSCKINMNIPEVMHRMVMECHMKTNHIDNCFKLNTKTAGGEHKRGGGCCGDKEKQKKK